MSKSVKKEKHSQIVIDGKCFSDITIVNQDNEPVAIITPEELVTMSGFKAMFNVGESD